MAWLIGCRHGMARRLSPWRGSQVGGLEVVGIAWHGGCRRRLLAWHDVVGWREGCISEVAGSYVVGWREGCISEVAGSYVVCWLA
jgi:hypothetical protein